jgi:hypothetical protein
MRLLIVALMLLMTPAYALERVPVALVKELSPPALDADGCALPAAGRHTERNTDGVLVTCGMLVNDQRDGYWVYAKDGYFMHGWYHEGQTVGTWLALTAMGSLLGVWRFDQAGAMHGISYGLEGDGRLAWKQMHLHGRRVFACEGWKWPC